MLPTQTPTDGEGGGASEKLKSFRSATDRIARAEHRKMLEGVATASSTMASLVGAPLPGAQLMVMVIGCNRMEELPLFLHPTQWEIGSGEQRVYLGCVAGNALIGLIFTLLHCVVVRLWRFHRRGGQQYYEAGVLRFPAITIVCYVVIFQGTVLSALRLTFNGDILERVVGVITSFLVLLLTSYIVWVLGNAPRRAVYFLDTKVVTRSWQRFLVGPGEWLSKHELYVERYGTAFVQFNKENTGFLGADLLLSSVLALVAVIESRSLLHCGVLSFAKSAACLVHAVISFIRCPQALPRNTALDVTKNLALSGGAVFASAGYYTEDSSHWGFHVAGGFFVFAGLVLVVRNILDLTGLLLLLITKRRQRLQAEYDKTLGALPGDDDELLGSSTLRGRDMDFAAIDEHLFVPDDTRKLCLWHTPCRSSPILSVASTRHSTDGAGNPLSGPLLASHTLPLSPAKGASLGTPASPCTPNHSSREEGGPTLARQDASFL